MNHDMDVQPSRISLSMTPLVSVVLHSRAGFDATALDAAALRLMVTGTAVEPNRRGAAVNTTVRDFDGDPKRTTEMDALIAYLQMLGTQVDFEAVKAQERPR